MAGIKRSFDASELAGLESAGKRSKFISGLMTPTAELDARLDGHHAAGGGDCDMHVEDSMLEDAPAFAQSLSSSSSTATFFAPADEGAAESAVFPELDHGALQSSSSSDMHMDTYTDPHTGATRSFPSQYQQQQTTTTMSPSSASSTLSVYPATPPADEMSEAEAFARYALTHGYNKMQGKIEVMQMSTGCPFGSDSVRELEEPHEYNWDNPSQSTAVFAMNMGAHQI